MKLMCCLDMWGHFKKKRSSGKKMSGSLVITSSACFPFRGVIQHHSSLLLCISALSLVLVEVTVEPVVMLRLLVSHL